jgi:hypothetical protein
MKESARALCLAVLMFVATLVLRRHHNDTAIGFSITAVMAMWLFLVWPIRLKWGQAGVEQWRSIRQRGRTYFVVTHGTWWFLFFMFFRASMDFASAQQIQFKLFWLQLLAGIIVGPLAHIWEWRRRERRFLESQHQ